MQDKTQRGAHLQAVREVDEEVVRLFPPTHHVQAGGHHHEGLPALHEVALDGHHVQPVRTVHHVLAQQQLPRKLLDVPATVLYGDLKNWVKERR